MKIKLLVLASALMSYNLTAAGPSPTPLLKQLIDTTSEMCPAGDGLAQLTEELAEIVTPHVPGQTGIATEALERASDILTYVAADPEQSAIPAETAIQAAADVLQNPTAAPGLIEKALEVLSSIATQAQDTAQYYLGDLAQSWLDLFSGCPYQMTAAVTTGVIAAGTTCYCGYRLYQALKNCGQKQKAPTAAGRNKSGKKPTPNSQFCHRRARKNS